MRKRWEGRERERYTEREIHRERERERERGGVGRGIAGEKWEGGGGAKEKTSVIQMRIEGKERKI